MLEVILVWIMGKNIAAKAKAKGHAPAGYVVLLVVLWLIGEIGGAIVGFAITAARDGIRQDDGEILLVYVGAIFGAILGAITSFIIVGALPDRSSRQWDLDYKDEEEDEFRRRRSREAPGEYDDPRRVEDKWDKDERFDR
jgi:hypothetical protein